MQFVFRRESSHYNSVAVRQQASGTLMPRHARVVRRAEYECFRP